MKLYFAPLAYTAGPRPDLQCNVTVMEFSAKLCMRGARPAWARIALRCARARIYRALTLTLTPALTLTLSA